MCWLPGAGRHPLHLFFSHQETLPALFRQQAKQPARIHMEDVSHRAKRNRHLSAPPAETAAARTGRRSEEVSKKSPSSRGGGKKARKARMATALNQAAATRENLNPFLHASCIKITRGQPRKIACPVVIGALCNTQQSFRKAVCSLLRLKNQPNNL